MKIRKYCAGESVTESILSSSCSSSVELRPPGHSKVSKMMKKLQILSPISDKSQEHSSSPSGGGSPQDSKLNSSRVSGGDLEDVNQNSWSSGPSKYSSGRGVATTNTTITSADKKKRNVDLNLNLNLTESNEGHGLSFKTLKTPDIQQYLNVPWDIPKLKSKLKNKRNCFRGQSSSPESSPKKVVLKKSPDVEVNINYQLK